MAYYVRPGGDLELSAGPTLTGLTGTIGVRIMDGEGGTVLARQTAGIIEQPAGSGLYVLRISNAAPTVAGRYQVVWDTGGASPVWATETMEVLSSLPGVAGPSNDDLCTLSDVRAMMQFGDGETEQDTILSVLITRASKAISRYSQREFVNRGPLSRRFDWQPGRTLLDLAPFDLRAATAVALVTPDGSTPIAPGDYQLGPNPSVDGVYRIVRLRPEVRYLGAGGILPALEITGTWGFPAIPDDIIQAAVATVVTWTRRDVSAFTSTYNLDEARVERPEGLPSAVRALVGEYRLEGVG